MTVGAGIFAGATVIAIVALFIATKDRWNWRKIILWPLLSLVGLAIAGGLGIWAWNIYEGRPKVQTTFGAVTLGESMDEVRFKKGALELVDSKKERMDSEKGKDPTYHLSVDSGPSYRIRFRDGKVLAIYAFTTEKDYSTNIQGIYFDASAEQIIEKFGHGAEIQRSVDGVRRSYAYPKYHVFFGLGTNKVQVMGIYDGAGPGPLTPQSDDKK